MVRKSLALVFALALLAIPLAACGDDDDDSDTAATSDTTAAETTTGSDTSAGSGGETIAISETEYQLDPADPTAKAGEVTFEVTNDGTIVHNLEVEGDGIEEETEDLDAGASGELTVDLEPGTYEIYCAPHVTMGMKARLIVER